MPGKVISYSLLLKLRFLIGVGIGIGIDFSLPTPTTRTHPLQRPFPSLFMRFFKGASYVSPS